MKGKRKKSSKRHWVTREVREISQEYDEETTYNPHLKAAILEVVENQLRGGDPLETRQTLERLVAAGYSRQEAVEMIGSVVVSEIWHILRAFLNSNKVNLSEPKQTKSIIVLFPTAAFRKIESEYVSLVHSLCWLNTFANRCNSVSDLVSSRHSSKGMAVRGHPRSCICSSSLSMLSATSQRRHFLSRIAYH